MSPSPKVATCIEKENLGKGQLVKLRLLKKVPDTKIAIGQHKKVTTGGQKS